jgi:hypothetical protein
VIGREISYIGDKARTVAGCVCVQLGRKSSAGGERQQVLCVQRKERKQERRNESRLLLMSISYTKRGEPQKNRHRVPLGYEHTHAGGLFLGDELALAGNRRAAVANASSSRRYALGWPPIPIQSKAGGGKQQSRSIDRWIGLITHQAELETTSDGGEAISSVASSCVSQLSSSSQRPGTRNAHRPLSCARRRVCVPARKNRAGGGVGLGRSGVVGHDRCRLTLLL